MYSFCAVNSLRMSFWSVPESEALEDYQLRRDALSANLFDATDRIAAYDWDLSVIRQMLRRVSSAMTDEVELLQSLTASRPTAVPSG